MKFWLALILGTIGISAGLTFLNLYKGAQTLSYPPPAPPVKPSRIKFVEVRQAKPEMQTLIRANAITFQVGDTEQGDRHEAQIRFSNAGQADLILTFKDSSSNKEGQGPLDVVINDTRITGTNPRFTLPPGGSALLKLTWAPGRGDVMPPDARTKARAFVRFEHNDDRYIDDLIFEIRGNVTR
jgi:hypothetical protein